jgi:DNA-binding IscR family transcriptional regulator
MAISIISQVWQYPHLRDQSQLLIMLALADFSNEHGQSFPAVSTLADRARVSGRHARKILAHLEKHKLLEVNKGEGMGQDQWQRTNLYKINLGMLLSRTEIPTPDYEEEKKRAKKNKEKKTECHSDTPSDPPVIVTPPVTETLHPLSQEAEKAVLPPVTVTPKPSEEEENRQREPLAESVTDWQGSLFGSERTEPSRPKAKRVMKLVTEDDLPEWQSDPGYELIDVRTQFHRAMRWCKRNRKHLTENRFENWLSKAEPSRFTSNTPESPSPGFKPCV